ncbi:MAG TPA: hypothetical protein VLZ75_14815 [Chitinophagales bacterium]|nr:hypothetical protein [Chitinophagales bacterium]
MRAINHSCKEIKTKIELYLDGELDRYSKQEVDNIISECPFCKNEFENQSSLKQIIHIGLKRKECTDHLKMNIVNKIRGL